MKLVFLVLLLLVSLSAWAFSVQNFQEETRCGLIHFTVTQASGNTINTEMRIPSNSIVKHTTIFVQDTIVSASDNTIAIGCESTNDLKVATDFTNSATGTIVAGAQTADSNATYVETGCKVKAKVGAGLTGITNGDLVVCSNLLFEKPKY